MPNPLTACDFIRRSCVAVAALALLVVTGRPAVADEPAAVGQTRVARWQDDKAACFLLMFDDSWPSHSEAARI